MFFFAACNPNQPLGDPYPDEDFVSVVYQDFVTQIQLDENYPNETQNNVRIAVFNCYGKCSSVFWHSSA
jgi:hypothetical protein